MVGSVVDTNSFVGIKKWVEGIRVLPVTIRLCDWLGFDGVRCLSETVIKLARYENHSIDIIVDRLVRRDDIERRLTDSLETALRIAEGVAGVELMGKDGETNETLTFSQHLACPECGSSFEELAPRNFSFNSPRFQCRCYWRWRHC